MSDIVKIIVEIGHPAHVHHFKNMVLNLESKGHKVKICTTDKDLTIPLLRALSFDYYMLGVNKSGNLLNKLILLIEAEYRMFRIAKRFEPDIFISRASPISAHVSRFLHKPHVVFNDTECALLTDILTLPFTDAICTPSCIRKDYGKKHVRSEWYKELAYLHPNYFKPDPAVLGCLGLSERDRFVIVRFVAWQAAHDVRKHGFDLGEKRKLVTELEKYGRVLITSEKPLPEELEKYRVTAPPENMHDLLYYATLLISDSQTMTTEAAVLGTPAVRCNSFVGPSDMGNFIELENKYDLIYSFSEPDKAIRKAIELIQQPDLKERWSTKRNRMLAEKIDVTAFMVDFIENYPESFARYKQGTTSQK